MGTSLRWFTSGGLGAAILTVRIAFDAEPAIIPPWRAVTHFEMDEPIDRWDRLVALLLMVILQNRSLVLEGHDSQFRGVLRVCMLLVAPLVFNSQIDADGVRHQLQWHVSNVGRIIPQQPLFVSEERVPILLAVL